MNNLNLVANAGLVMLNIEPYPGRGIVCGLDKKGECLIQVYWIMGRSENSRNRVLKFDQETGRVYTAAADRSRMQNPELVIYTAMREQGPHFIVSNGDQTDTVMRAFSLDPHSRDLHSALADRTYEPDKPNYTPRITGMCSILRDSTEIQLSILRRSVFDDGCDRALYEYRGYPGYGHCLTTYGGRGDPLPSFRRDPFIVPLNGSMEKIAEDFWCVLNEENRVALAVKQIKLFNGRSDVHIINKYTEVG